MNRIEPRRHNVSHACLGGTYSAAWLFKIHLKGGLVHTKVWIIAIALAIIMIGKLSPMEGGIMLLLTAVGVVVDSFAARFKIAYYSSLALLVAVFFMIALHLFHLT